MIYQWQWDGMELGIKIRLKVKVKVKLNNGTKMVIWFDGMSLVLKKTIIFIK